MSQNQSTSADQPEATELNPSVSRQSSLLTARSSLSVCQAVPGQSCCPGREELKEYQAMVAQMHIEQEHLNLLKIKTNRQHAEALERRAESQRVIDAMRKVLKHREGRLKKSRLLLGEDKNERNKLLIKKMLMAQDQLRQFQLERNRYEELKVTVTCAICLNARCSTAFQCGHLSCGDCSGHLLHCHICRVPILQRTHIFL